MAPLKTDASVEARSAGLRKDLGVADLTLTQILFIVGLPWVGVAAKQGPAHVVLWLAAIVLFYLPIVQVESRLRFAIKISAVIVLTNVLGLAVFLGRRPRTNTDSFVE